MTDKVCIIKQPAGIGDIFFCQKIAQSVREETEYKKVIWPVASTYSYLKDYMIAEDVEFIDFKTNHGTDYDVLGAYVEEI